MAAARPNAMPAVLAIRLRSGASFLQKLRQLIGKYEKEKRPLTDAFEVQEQ
jgi:hypothetical protein